MWYTLHGSCETGLAGPRALRLAVRETSACLNQTENGEHPEKVGLRAPGLQDRLRPGGGAGWGKGGDTCPGLENRGHLELKEEGFLWGREQQEQKRGGRGAWGARRVPLGWSRETGPGGGLGPHQPRALRREVGAGTGSSEPGSRVRCSYRNTRLWGFENSRRCTERLHRTVVFACTRPLPPKRSEMQDVASFVWRKQDRGPSPPPPTPMTPSQAPPPPTHLSPPLWLIPSSLPLQPGQRPVPPALGQFVHLQQSSLPHPSPWLTVPRPRAQLMPCPARCPLSTAQPCCSMNPHTKPARRCQTWSSGVAKLPFSSVQSSNSPWLCGQSSLHFADGKKGMHRGAEQPAPGHTASGNGAKTQVRWAGPEALPLTPPTPASVLPCQLSSMPDSISRHRPVPSRRSCATEAAFSFNPHSTPGGGTVPVTLQTRSGLRRWPNSLAHVTEPIRAEPGPLPGLSDPGRSDLPRDGRRPACPASLPPAAERLTTGSDLPTNCIKACGDAPGSRGSEAVPGTHI